jgi:hypothetical protein
VRPDRLDQLRAHGHHRVERGHRLLEDHRDAVAPQGPHPRFGQAQQVGAAQPHRARRRAHVRGRRPMMASAVIDFPDPTRPRGQRSRRAPSAKESPGRGPRPARCGRDREALDGGRRRGRLGGPDGFGQGHSKTPGGSRRQPPIVQVHHLPRSAGRRQTDASM